MATYRAFEVTGTREFSLVTRDLGEPPPGQVRVRVESCGVCHSDVLAVEGRRDDSEAPKAYERMMSGQARFRVVLDMTN